MVMYIVVADRETGDQERSPELRLKTDDDRQSLTRLDLRPGDVMKVITGGRERPHDADAAFAPCDRPDPSTRRPGGTLSGTTESIVSTLDPSLVGSHTPALSRSPGSRCG